MSREDPVVFPNLRCPYLPHYSNTRFPKALPSGPPTPADRRSDRLRSNDTSGCRPTSDAAGAPLRALAVRETDMLLHKSLIHVKICPRVKTVCALLAWVARGAYLASVLS